MLEKPDISLARIAACLQTAYGVTAVRITFLPWGADRNTAVYRIETTDETPYFLKLRSGVFDETAVTLPQFLRDQGIRQIITPLTTKTGQLWTTLAAFTAILYPFVDGRNGRELKLSAAQWAAFGVALKKLHTLTVPPAIRAYLRQEAYSPRWREMVKMFLGRIQSDGYDDPVALELAAFLRRQHEPRRTIINENCRRGQAGSLSYVFSPRPPRLRVNLFSKEQARRDSRPGTAGRTVGRVVIERTPGTCAVPRRHPRQQRPG